tara:strand:+ start:108 stop:377 length:270 start_codon:yes stop_codon:yes gene_type:complete
LTVKTIFYKFKFRLLFFDLANSHFLGNSVLYFLKRRTLEGKEADFIKNGILLKQNKIKERIKTTIYGNVCFYKFFRKFLDHFPELANYF